MASRRRDEGDEQDATISAQFDPFQILLHHKWLIVGFGLIGISLGYLHYTRQIPIYESAATLLVVPEKTNNLPIEMIDSSRSADESLSTQMVLIRSSLVLQKAVTHQGLKDIPSIIATGNPTAAIMGGLSVSQARASNGSLANEILELRFRGTDPVDCGKVLAIVIDAYQEFLGETRQSISEETVKLIDNARLALSKDLVTKDREYQESLKNAPASWNGESDSAIRAERLAQIEAARTTLVISCSNLRAQVAALDLAMRKGTRREVLEILARQIAEDTGKSATMAASAEVRHASFEEQVKELKIEEEILEERYGARHPKLVSLRRRLQIMSKLLEEEQAPEVIELASGEVEKADVVSLYMESLKQELAISEQQKSELDSVFQQELEEARSIEEFENLVSVRLADIARTNQLFDGVVKRLQEISLIKDAGGTYTQIIESPGAGGKVLPRLSTTLASGLMLGVALGFALGAVLELSNRDFRSVDELSILLEIGVLGQFDDSRSRSSVVPGSQIHPTVVAFHEPQSPVTESYRGLRTCLYFSAADQNEAPRTIQITSPLPGDGKSTLVANLGVVMAQSGKRVAVIEADMRKPRLARIFGMTPSPGLTALLSGEAELDECIQATEVENLWLLPVGKRPANPSELLGSAAFRQLLELFREKFDLVLIDSAPLLPVTDASVIAALTDGVVCLFKVRKNMREAAQASMEKLKDVGAHVLGGVVHGHFQRESRQNSQYGYRYSYYYEDDKGEYDESDRLVTSDRQIT